MIKCAKCASENEDDSSFCDQCAAALRRPAVDDGEKPAADDEGGGCPDCGGAVRRAGNGKGICTRCGAKLVEEEDGDGEVVAAAPPPAPSGELVVVYTAANGLGAFTEAGLVQSQLQAAGFACEMLNPQHATMVFGGGVSIGIRLVVPESQAQAARRFLEDARRTRRVEPADDEPA